MSEIVNLRTARKRKAREQARAEGDANRALHGRTKAEVDSVERLREKAERDLDGKKRPPKGD